MTTFLRIALIGSIWLSGCATPIRYKSLTYFQDKAFIEVEGIPVISHKDSTWDRILECESHSKKRADSCRQDQLQWFMAKLRLTYPLVNRQWIDDRFITEIDDFESRTADKMIESGDFGSSVRNDISYRLHWMFILYEKLTRASYRESIALSRFNEHRNYVTAYNNEVSASNDRTWASVGAMGSALENMNQNQRIQSLERQNSAPKSRINMPGR